MDREGIFAPGDLVAHGKFRVLRLLGSGATSHVYAAEFVADVRRRAAVKYLRPTLSYLEPVMRRFEREKDTGQLVGSDYIVPLIAAGVDRNGRLWLVFALFDGESLDRLLPLGSAEMLTADDVRTIVPDLLRGLEDAHAVKVVHRDLKPSNIFIRRMPDGALRAMILDFGVAKLLELPNGGNPSALTIMGTPIGTLDYMPPEQIADATKVDERADIYAVGVVLFRILAGCVPFVGRSRRERAEWKRTHEPLTLRALTGMAWPAAIEDFLAKASARDPSRRYQTARDARKDWRRVIAAIKGLPRPTDAGWSASERTESGDESEAMR